MTGVASTSVHASAVQVGNRAVLIRGPSGSGKSRLAFELILAGRAGQIAPTLLVGDDRVHLDVSAMQLLVRPVRTLAGLIEIYGLGIRRCEFVEQAIVGLVVDLAAQDAERLPSPEILSISIKGIKIPRIPIHRGFNALPVVVAALTTANGADFDAVSTNCVKGNSNHMGPSMAPK
ncbi:MAG TPA: HPr kinase/phosphatase C-terminal domain-containing protein [Bradyrhizobium sp.]|nr:HPr kinase/phosphatase C-terminal domain-containing protein [Bradyrhizobium sp.]